MFRAPFRFAETFFTKLYPGVVRRHAVVELHSAQVVLVAAFEMNEFAKKSFAHHLQHSHHIAAVTNVFQKHEVRTRGFVSVHELPALIERESAANFGSDVFSSLHGGDALLGVPFPGCRNHHSINVLVFQKIEIIVVAFIENGGFFLAFFGNHFERIGHHTRVGVGDGGDFAIVAKQGEFYVTLASKAHTNEADAQIGPWRLDAGRWILCCIFFGADDIWCCKCSRSERRISEKRAAVEMFCHF